MLFGCIFFCSMLRDSMKKIEDLDAEHWHVGRRTSSRRSGERGSLPLPKKKGKKSNKAKGDLERGIEVADEEELLRPSSRPSSGRSRKQHKKKKRERGP
jgi:hypothetical protein